MSPGAGGTLIFSPNVGLGPASRKKIQSEYCFEPASTVHPKINIRNFKKYCRFCTLSLRKDPKMHRNDPYIAQFCDNPRKYSQNLHTQNNIHFSEHPKKYQNTKNENIGSTQLGFECLTLLKTEVIEYGKKGFKMA